MLLGLGIQNTMGERMIWTLREGLGGGGVRGGRDVRLRGGGGGVGMACSFEAVMAALVDMRWRLGLRQKMGWGGAR